MRGLLAAAVVVPALAGCQPLAPQPPGAVAAAVADGGQQDAGSVDAAAPPVAPGAVAAPPVVPDAPVVTDAPDGTPPVEAPAVEAPVESPVASSSLGAAAVGALPGPEAGAESDPVLSAPEGTGDRATAGGSPAATPGNPLAGDRLHGPNAGAAEAATRLAASRPADAALLADLARVPTATWLGAWLPDVTATVEQRIADAQKAGGVPVFVAYNVPNLDCGGHSASGGAGSASAYETWIRAVAAGIGSAEAVVILEPDTLALLCGSTDERLGLLRTAVGVLEANPKTHTYLDAGHSNWVDVATTAARLRAAGVEGADGFALNVSNFEPTEDNVAFGAAVSAALGGAHFVVDTSRNGNGPGDDWCNPAGRAVGLPTTTQTGHPLVDAFVWVKTPGESDGPCNGGPAAGQFWVEYAVGLARG